MLEMGVTLKDKWLIDYSDFPEIKLIKVKANGGKP
jgi:hypothetical protein